MKKTDQFVAAVLLFFSAAVVLSTMQRNEGQTPAYAHWLVTGLLGVFAGVLNLLRVAYMRNASGLRVCSIIANGVCLVFMLLHRILFNDQLGVFQFSTETVALILSVIHQPRVRINGLGRFDYGAGG